MTTESDDATQAGRKAAAGRILARAVETAPLPPFVPGEASSVAATIAGIERAHGVLHAVARVWGVHEWTEESFREAFLEGALAAWKPGTAVDLPEPSAIRVRSPSCPVIDLVLEDPRVCTACRAIQEATTRLALPGRVKSVAFDRVATRGDDACALTIRLHPARAAAP